MDPLTSLQDWLAEQCDGVWEHEHGITIDTIDNPGWHVRIALVGTELENVTLEPVEVSKSEDEWYRCKLEGRTFEAFGGPRNLRDIVEVFLDLLAVR
jgi:hypothetical protein